VDEDDSMKPDRHDLARRLVGFVQLRFADIFASDSSRLASFREQGRANAAKAAE
jgi:hypothetical protein